MTADYLPPGCPSPDGYTNEDHKAIAISETREYRLRVQEVALERLGDLLLVARMKDSTKRSVFEMCLVSEYELCERIVLGEMMIR